MAQVLYDAKTGAKLLPGQTTNQGGVTLTQGQIYNQPNQQINTKDQYIAPAGMPGYGGISRRVLNPNYKPVNANDLQGATDINLPEQKYTDYSGLLQGANLTQTNPDTGVVGTAKGITVTPPITQTGLADEANKKSGNLFQQLLGYIPQRESVQASIQNSQQYQQVEQARQNVQNYTNQLNSIQTKLQADQLAQTGQGRGIPEAIIGGIQAQLSKEAAIQSLPIQALLANSQGMLDIAQRHLDDLYKLRTEEVNNKYDYQKTVFSAISNYIDKSDQRTYEAASKDMEFKRARDLELEKERAKKMENAVSRQAPTSYINAINKATDLVSLAQAAGKYNIDAKDAASIAASNASTAKSNAEAKAANNSIITNTLDPKKAQAINTILGSGKFTKDQATAIRNAINNGEDPFTVIKNQGKALMTGANQTKVESYETAQFALNNLEKNLSDYYKSGGKTNIFKGNIEKTINKLGEVKDPKLVELATQIQQNLQIYRNAVSGTAYSVQEGADIASIFPGIKKSEGLNNAIIKGRRQAFIDGIDGAYKGVLGSAYDQFKTAEKQTQQPQSVGTTFMKMINGKATTLELHADGKYYPVE